MLRSTRTFHTTSRLFNTQLNSGLRFRDFIQRLKNENDLIEINDLIDPHLEVGAITRKVYETRSPAPLFNNLKGTKDQNLFRILGAPGGLRKDPKEDHGRIAAHLNLPKETHVRDIIQFLLDCKHMPPVPPTIVSNKEAPVKQNIKSGNEINFNELPVPYLHPSDGGKYLQTYGMWIIQTPDGKWTNWSIARGMVAGDNKVTGLVINPQHIREIADQWAAIGKGDKIPISLCFGVPPAAILVSSMPLPSGVNEADFISSTLGESLPLVKGETNDLLVPATSEIVLEGHLNFSEISKEGPFGEMHGYVFGKEGRDAPTYTFDSISYRNNAILPVSNPGIAVDETHTLIGMLVATECKQMAIDEGLPILDVFLPYETQVLWAVFRVDLKKLRELNTTPEEFCKKIGDIYFKSKVGFIVHEIVLVGDDVDIYDFSKVIWAYTTRHTPSVDQLYYDDVTSFALAPFVSQSERIKPLKGGKAVTNCLFPKQFQEEVDFTTCDFNHYEEDLKTQVNENWKRWGYT